MSNSNPYGIYASGREACDKALNSMKAGDGHYAAHWRVVKTTPAIVWVVDEAHLHDCKSVTNDAERVCHVLFQRFGNRRFLYRDTDGNWDELAHDEHGQFLDFKPARGQEPGSWSDD